jgi:hypothetical protein
VNDDGVSDLLLLYDAVPGWLLLLLCDAVLGVLLNDAPPRVGSDRELLRRHRLQVLLLFFTCC